MTNWDHVADNRMRNILVNNECDEDSICYALAHTLDCLWGDYLNEAVSIQTLDKREDKYEDAYLAWNEMGNATQCLEYLKEYWGV